MANPGLDAPDERFRALDVEGYRPPQQLRTIETTRRMVAAAWELMVERPCVPLHVEDVLARSGAATSSFYARFDNLDALVEVAGILAIDLGDRLRRPGRGPVEPSAAVCEATRRAFAPILVPGVLPREVLAVGAWRAGYVSARLEGRQRRLLALAGEAASLDRRTSSRLATWLHLASATCEVAWSTGVLALGTEAVVELVARAELLGCRLLAPDDDVVRRARSLHDAAPPRVVRPSVTGVSDRSARAVAELRSAVRAALVEHGRAMTTGDVARSVHRSRASFGDAFGTVGAALADLARAEQVARIPTELFRPRPDVGTGELVAHLARRIHAWQDAQGLLGRRLLQASAAHPELAVEVVGQLQDSAELLAGWYGDHLDVGDALARLVFVMLLSHEVHQVVWGSAPASLGGPEAVASLFERLLDAPAPVGA